MLHTSSRQLLRIEKLCVVVLHEVLERQRLDGLRLGLKLVEVAHLRLARNALQVDALTARASSLLGLLVLRNARADLILALGSVDVLDARVDVLLNDLAVDKLVHADADGPLGDVEHDTSSAMVVLEGHTLVLGRVHLDVHMVSVLLNAKDNASPSSTKPHHTTPPKSPK